MNCPMPKNKFNLLVSDIKKEPRCDVSPKETSIPNVDAASDVIAPQAIVPVDFSIASSCGSTESTDICGRKPNFNHTTTSVVPSSISVMTATADQTVSLSAANTTLSVSTPNSTYPSQNSSGNLATIAPKQPTVIYTCQQRQTVRQPSSGVAGSSSVSGLHSISNPIQLLHKVRQMSNPDLSNALRLDLSALLQVVGSQKHFRDPPITENASTAPNVISSPVDNPPEVESGSRKGQHLCLFCRRSFSNAALFASHIQRPVARIIYRCHLCPNISACRTVVVPALYASHPNDNSGLLSATNLCALYAHMMLRHSHDHPNPEDWRLVNSRLSVTALPWKSGGPLEHKPTDDDRLLEGLGKRTFRPSVCIDLEGGIDGENGVGEEIELSQATQYSFPVYIDGQELVDLRNDLGRTMTGLLRTNEFQFLPRTLSSSFQGKAKHVKSLLRMPDIRAMATNPVFLPSNVPDSLSSNDLALPSPGSSKAHLIFRLAEASIWNGHFFLCGWNPTMGPATEQEKSPDDKMQDADKLDKKQDAVDKESVPSTPLPTAASNKQLNEAVAAFTCNQSASGGKSSVAPAWQSLLCPSAENKGLLRCLICGDFRTNSPASLAIHLGGTSLSVPGKCALCSLSVSYNKANFCSVKAHLLFHLGIFIMCPQCGFTPPPDLPPDLAELCLRVHLRFVCFHFNVVQIFLCTSSECGSKAYTMLSHFVQHWLETHTQRRFACLLCQCSNAEEDDQRTTTSSDASTGRFGRGSLPPATPMKAPSPLLTPGVSESYKYSDSASIRRHLELEHQLSEVQLTLSTVGNYYASGFVCSECNHISPTSIAFSTHFSTMHCRTTSTASTAVDANFAVTTSLSPCEAHSCFRCFGICKRIHNDLSDFRAHQLNCPDSLRLLSATYGPLLRLTTPPSSSEFDIEARGSGDDRASGGTSVCFCLYCGIGGRKNRGATSTALNNNQTTGAQLRVSPAPKGPSSSVSPLVESPLHVDNATLTNPSEYQPRPSRSVIPITLSKLPVSNASAYCTVSTFPDLDAVHAHERQEHVAYEGNRQIGCPWCPQRQACSSPEHTQLIIDHLHMHIKANPYITWYLHRRNQLKENHSDAVFCYCGTGLLDCPMALMAHATCDPTISTTMHGLQSSQLLPTTLLGSSTPEGAGDDEKEGTNETPSTTHSACAHTTTICPPLRPAGHVPCSPAVYNHLRFGEFPSADALLKYYATGAQREFLCPLCSTIEMTRWALTEHAFNVHWTRLCYVCCEYVPTETTVDFDEPSVPGSPGRNLSESISAPENGTLAHSKDTPSSESSSAPRTSQQKKKQFWDHVFTCLTNRHHTLLALHRSGSPEKIDLDNDSVVKMNIGDDDEGDDEYDDENKKIGSKRDYTLSGLPNSEIEFGDPPSVGVPSLLDMGQPASIVESRGGHPDAAEPPLRSTSRLSSTEECATDDDPACPKSAKVPRLETENEDISLDETLTAKSRQNSFVNERLFRGCFLCEAKCSWDAYEEHMMSHQTACLDSSSAPLESSVNVLAGERPTLYKCYICSRRFLERSTCKQHMIVRHALHKSEIHWSKLIDDNSSINPAERPPPGGVFPFTPGVFTCAQCFDEFKTRRRLRVHVTECHPLKENGWKSSYCDDCGLSFLSDLSLRIHRRSAHLRSEMDVHEVFADDEELSVPSLHRKGDGTSSKGIARSSDLPQIL